MSASKRDLGLVLAGAALAGALALAYRLGAARAEGMAIPNTLYYAGELSDHGQPVDGIRDFTLTLWSDPAGTAAACVTDATGVEVDGGRFRFALDEACVEAVRKNPELWLQLSTGGTPLESTKLGAVPYAVRALQAASADTLGNLPPTELARAAHAHDGDYLPLGTRLDCPNNQVAAGLDESTGNVICRAAGGTGAGAVYTRWGNSTCPAGVELVYSGWMAGKHYTHRGSGTNYLCLTQTPSWLEYNDRNDNDSSLLYGVEYQTLGANASVLSSASAYEQDAVCAVCLDPGAGSQLMVPGTSSCPAGWTEQYEGYLMSASHGHGHGGSPPYAHEYICVDTAFEGRTGGSANQNGALLYFTEAECGSLPCAPYVQDREITCVVCTR